MSEELNAAISEMDRAIMALAYELPAEVWRDVKRRYDTLRSLIDLENPR